jgi:hypothetical protein
MTNPIRPTGVKMIHNFGAATESAERQTPAHEFAERCQVRMDAEDLLQRTMREPCGLHLVED